MLAVEAPWCYVMGFGAVFAIIAASLLVLFVVVGTYVWLQEKKSWVGRASRGVGFAFKGLTVAFVVAALAFALAAATVEASKWFCH